jgi:hypothetical protein
MANKHSLLSKITPDVAGIFWFTDIALTPELENFNDFDYLYDGLISEYLFKSNEDQIKASNSFCTKSFGSTLWLIHLGPNVTSSHIDEQISLLTKSENENKKFLIKVAGQKKWEAELPKRYPKLKFEII